MARAIVLHNNILAGELIRHGGSAYEFRYDSNYLATEGSRPISISLPLRTDPFFSKRLFPFFEGLIAEGWLRRQQSLNQKIDEQDFFSLLINNGQDLIGAVSVLPAESKT